MMKRFTKSEVRQLYKDLLNIDLTDTQVKEITKDSSVSLYLKFLVLMAVNAEDKNEGLGYLGILLKEMTSYLYKLEGRD